MIFISPPGSSACNTNAVSWRPISLADDSSLEGTRFEPSVTLAVETLLGHAFRRPTLCGSNPGGHGGGCWRYEFDFRDQNLAAGSHHRAQPCSGYVGNFGSRHLISGRAVSALLEGFHRR